MNLKKLQYAVAIEEDLSFAKAAERLNLSQSALTRSIQALESDLGLRLFDRDASGVRVTPAGSDLLAKARVLLRDANGFKREAELLRGAKSGKLVVGIGPIPAHAILSGAMVAVLNTDGAVRVQVEVQPAAKLLDLLLSENIEFFVSGTFGLEFNEGVIAEPLGELGVGFYVGKNHPCLADKKAAPETLYQYPLVSHGIYQTMASEYVQGLSIKQWPSQLGCENLQVLKEVTAQTHAVLLTAHALVKKEVASGELLLLESVSLPQTKSTDLSIFYLKNRSLSPLAHSAIEAFKSQMKNHV